MAKQLDRFLVSEVFLDSVELNKKWVVNGDDSDHFPIILYFLGDGRKPPNPFKFNLRWLDDKSFGELVKAEWVPFNMERD